MSTEADIEAARQITAARRMSAAIGDLGLLTSMPSDQMRTIVRERLAGLNLSASELKVARRDLAKRLHPDRRGAKTNAQMAAVNATVDAVLADLEESK